MAYYSTGSVYVVSSSAAQASVVLPGVKSIQAVKFFSNQSSTSSTTSSAAIISNNVAGAQLWFDNRVGGPIVDLTNIYDGDGVQVSLSSGASVWIYSRVNRG